MLQDMEKDLTVDGAMFQSLMKMDMRVLDVLMLEMTHGTVVINMIPPLAHQDGLVTKLLENVLWPTQVMDSEVNQHARITADHTQDQDPAQDQTPTDVILPHIPAINVKKEIPVVIKIEMSLAATARTLIQLNSLNVTELTQNNQNVSNALRIKRTDANQEVRPVTAVPQSQTFSNVTQKHSLVLKLNNKEISSKPVMLNVVTSPHKSFSVPGEVLWQRKVNQRTSKWVRLI